MVIGQYSAGKDSYAGLQAAGAVTTIVILFLLARVVLPLRVLGGVGYSMIATGAFISALVQSARLCAGFPVDRRFRQNVQRLHTHYPAAGDPPQDFGKTVGVITLLNNMSQPLAGLLVALLAAPLGTQTVILILAVLTTILGTFAMWWFAKARGPSRA